MNAREALMSLLKKQPEAGLLPLKVGGRALSQPEAIGNPRRRDFPLLQGKEILLQVEVAGYAGQAFTADPLEFAGTVQSVLELPAERPGHEALLVATLNALARRSGLVENTVHCRDEEPETCAERIGQYIFDRHGECRVGMVGYQPAILEHCARRFGPERVRITDLNLDNIDQIRYGVEVWDGMTDNPRLIAESDVLLITGSVMANGTGDSLLQLIGDKPFYLFGTTAAALAWLNDWPRLCFCSK